MISAYDEYIDRYGVSDDELAHYGVKGMKWGIRKKRKNQGDEPDSEDYGEATRLRKKSANALSNDELTTIARRRNLENQAATKKTATNYEFNLSKLSDQELQTKLNRIRMETEYTKLTKDRMEAKAVNAGKAFVSQIIQDAVRTLLTEAVTNSAKKGASAAYGAAKTKYSASRTPQSPTVTTAIQLMPSVRRALNP